MASTTDPRADPPPPEPSTPRITLATNIRRLRRLRNLSSAQLARSASIGLATLSGLERGTGNPTLDTLQNLSATLGVPVTELLDGATRQPVTVVRADQGARVTRPNLDLRFVHRFTSGTLDVVELYDMTALPGEPHISNGHAGVENILVSEGTLKVGPTDSTVVLEAGDFVSFAADGPHVYSCESTEPVRAMLAMRHPADSIASSANDSVILALTDQQSPELED